MSEDAKPTAPGSFAKLMATPPPARPISARGQDPVPAADKQAIPPSATEDERDQPAPTGRTGVPAVRTDPLLDQIPPVPAKRRPERYAFQFWADQITRLKKLKQVLNIVTTGPDDREEITLSDLIREAVDDYLDKQIQQMSQSVRTDE